MVFGDTSLKRLEHPPASIPVFVHLGLGRRRGAARLNVQVRTTEEPAPAWAACTAAIASGRSRSQRSGDASTGRPVARSAVPMPPSRRSSVT